MKLSRRDRRTLILGAAALGAILAARFVLIPWVSGWSDARARIASEQEQLADMRSELSGVLGQHGRLVSKYGPAVSSPLADLETARVNLVKAAQDILKRNGFSATDYKPQPIRQLRKIPGARFVPLQVRGKCNVEQLAKCLAAMRNSKTLVIVDQLSVTNNQKQPGQLEVTIVLATLADQRRKRS